MIATQKRSIQLCILRCYVYDARIRTNPENIRLTQLHIYKKLKFKHIFAYVFPIQICRYIIPRMQIDSELRKPNEKKKIKQKFGRPIGVAMSPA